MKLIIFSILNIIDLNLISTKYLKFSDIFKGGNFKKNFNSNNRTKTINSINDYSLKDQKDLEEQNDSNNPEGDGGSGGNNEGGNRGENLNGSSGPTMDHPPKDIENQFENFILFMACCLKSGLTSDEEILQAYEWALISNYINNDKYSINDLVDKISKKFQTNYHNDWKISIYNHRHSCAIISERKIIFDYNGLRNLAKKFLVLKILINLNILETIKI